MLVKRPLAISGEKITLGLKKKRTKILGYNFLTLVVKVNIKMKMINIVFYINKHEFYHINLLDNS